MKFNYSGTDRWTCCQWGRASFVSISGHVSPEVAEESQAVQVQTTKEGWEEKWEEENNKKQTNKQKSESLGEETETLIRISKMTF